MADRARLGRDAEDQAVAYLVARGLVVLCRNHRYPGGEIDLIAQDGATLCFIEVRSRRNGAHGLAQETIGPKKQARIIRGAEHFLCQLWQGGPRPCRFDVVAIEGAGELFWFKDAFRVA